MGLWWYSYVYGGEFKDPHTTFDALKVLCEQYFWLIVGMLIVVLLATMLGNAWSVHLFRVLDKFGGRITFVAVWTVVLAFLLVYRAYHPTGPNVFERLTQINELTFNQMRAVNSLPAVQTPIDFHYLDSRRVDALYSQLEPELVEKQRTVAETLTGRAKAGIEAGPANVEAGVERGKASTSSYSRTDFSSERKCIVVMEYVIANNISRYYTSRDRWMLTNHMLWSIVEAQQEQSNVVLKGMGSGMPVKREPPPNEAEVLQKELENLQGLVFLTRPSTYRPKARYKPTSR